MMKIPIAPIALLEMLGTAGYSIEKLPKGAGYSVKIYTPGEERDSRGMWWGEASNLEDATARAVAHLGGMGEGDLNVAVQG